MIIKVLVEVTIRYTENRDEVPIIPLAARKGLLEELSSKCLPQGRTGVSEVEG